MELIDDLAARFPDVYASSEYVNGAGFGLVIYAAGELPTEFSETLASFSAAHQEWNGRITIEAAPYPLAVLTEMADDLTSRLSFLDDSSGITVVLHSESGAVTVELPNDEPKLADAIRNALDGFPLPTDYVVDGERFVLASCHEGLNGRLEGGRLFRMRRGTCNPNFTCTTGFAARLDGHEGVLTSGHCNGAPEGSSNLASIMYANGTTQWTSTRFYRERNNRYADAQFNREVWGSSRLGRLYLRDQVWRRITKITHQHPRFAVACVKGAATAHVDGDGDHARGLGCGWIEDSTVNPGGWRNAMAFARVKITNGSTTVRFGDSGAAVFFDDVARGLLMGVKGSGDPPYIKFYYSKIGFALSQLGGATLYTGTCC